MSKARAAAAVLIATLLAAAPAVHAEKQPKTVPGKEIASVLKSDLPRSIKVKVTKATCPKSIKNKKGQTATCKVTFVSGDLVGVRIRLTDTNGGFKPTLLDMFMRRLESQVESAIKAFKARAVCPEKRVVKKADTFTCDIYNGNVLTAYFDMTQAGGGQVTYKQRQAEPGAAPANPAPASF